jgi:hypothetical protein
LSGRRTVARAVGSWPFWLAVWAAIAVVRGVGLASRYINHDVAWYLHMAGVMLQGGRLYEDVVDTNPPLIVWLSTPPVLAARWFDAPDSAVFVVCVSGLVAASVFVCWRLFERVWPDLPPHVRCALITLVLYLVFVRVHLEFGQREHFTVLLSLPYVLGAMAWSNGRPMSRGGGFAAGSAAGLGLAMKPHLLVPALLVEGYLALVARDRRPWRRPEAAALAGTVLTYGLIVALLTPAYFEVAQRAAVVYRGLDPPAINLVRVPELALWGGAALLLAVARVPYGQRGWIVLFLAGTGFLLGGLGQMKGWPYHMFPARVFLTFFIGALGLRMLQSVANLPELLRGGTRMAASALAIAAVGATARQTLADRQPNPHDLVTPLRALIEPEARGGPVFVMGMLVYPAFPLVNVARLDWSSRHNSLWFLPGLYLEALDAPGSFRFRDAARMPPLERTFYEEIIGDLCDRPPSVLVVEKVTHYGAQGRRPFDLLTYYGQDPRFARLLNAYEPIGQVGAFAVNSARATPSCWAHAPEARP